jgi:hypothetical protein
MGVPYQDFIPLFPMVQDPATGEWRNAQPEEIPKPDQLPPGGDVVDIDDGTTDASRNVPPGGVSKPEPLPPYDDRFYGDSDPFDPTYGGLQAQAAGPTAFPPGTASDVPGGAEQQPPKALTLTCSTRSRRGQPSIMVW